MTDSMWTKLLKKAKFWCQNDFWYHPGYDMWFPKCEKCNPKGRRDTCPKDCMGDV